MSEGWMKIKGRDRKIFGRAAVDGPPRIRGRKARTRTTRLIPSEHDEQCAVIQWRDLQMGRWPELALLHAVPNGGHRHKAVAGKLRAEGVESGVPDLDLPVPRRGFHGLRIELKAEDGKLTEKQKWWLEQLSAQGYCAVVKHGADEAIGTIKWYLGIS